MPRLCVFGCAPSGVPMHRFPKVKKFPDLFKSWVILVGGKLESPSDYEYYQKKRVCDIHFTDKNRNRNNRINVEAIPSLHLRGSTSSQTISEQPLTQHFHQNAITLAEGPSGSQADPELPSRHHLQSVTASQPAEVASCTNYTPLKQLLLEHNYYMISKPRIMTGKGASKINRTCYVRPLCTKIKREMQMHARLRNAEKLFLGEVQIKMNEQMYYNKHKHYKNKK